MSRKRRKKKGTGLIAFLCLVIIGCLIVIVYFGRDYAKSVITQKVTEQVLEKVVEKALEESGDEEAAEKAKEIINTMNAEDKKAAEELVEKYADTDKLSKCVEILGDEVSAESLSQVKDYLEQGVSDEDMDKLKELYEKYTQ